MEAAAAKEVGAAAVAKEEEEEAAEAEVQEPVSGCPDREAVAVLVATPVQGA